MRIGEKTVLIVDVEKMDEAVEILKNKGVQIYGEELYKM
jgi:hypothetical protein